VCYVDLYWGKNIFLMKKTKNHLLPVDDRILNAFIYGCLKFNITT